MSNSWTGRGAAVLLVAFVAATPALGADEAGKVMLALQLEPGQTWSVETSTQTQLHVDTSAGGQIIRQAEQKSGDARKFTALALETPGGQLSALRLAFDPMCAAASQATGDVAKFDLYGYAGSCVTLRRAAGGAISHDCASYLDEVRDAELKGWMEGDIALPGKAVAIGEEWAPNPKAAATAYQLGPKDSLQGRCKLAGIKDVGGRKAAEVNVTMTLLKTDATGSQARVEVAGTTLIDVATGLPLEAKAEGKVTIAGALRQALPDGRVMAMQVSGTGTLTATAKFTVGPVVPLALLKARPAAPAGYLAMDDPAGTGRGLLGQRDTERSAKAMLIGVVADLGKYFDQPAAVEKVVLDKRQDQQALAEFASKSGGVDVRGLILINTEKVGRACIVYDAPAAAPQSLARLVTLARPAQLHEVKLGDGSGVLKAPDGWLVTASIKGMEDVSGPQGAHMSLGIWAPVPTPDSGLAGYTSPLLAPPQALVEITRAEAERLSRATPGVTVAQNVKILDPQPVVENGGSPGARSAMIHYSYDFGPLGGRTARYRAVASVITSPGGPGQWLYYFSQVQAPEAVFAARLPEMMEIWSSWKVSDEFTLKRLRAAAESMRQVSEMIRDAYAYRQRVQDDAHANFDEYIRGERYVRDTLLGEMRTAPLYKVTDIVEGLNKHAGYQRYEEVPLKDLYR